MEENTSSVNTEITSFGKLYHQTTPERAQKILTEGFQIGTEVGATGGSGPLRGVFIKETPELLKGARIGQAQLEVEIDPSVQILDLSNEEAPSFYDGPRELVRGSQDAALAGWLERHGEMELSEQYLEAVRKMYGNSRDYSQLDSIWPGVEGFLRRNGYEAVRYLDHFIDDERSRTPFSALVVFNADKVTPKALKN